jgi:hypothetical protein
VWRSVGNGWGKVENPPFTFYTNDMLVAGPDEVYVSGDAGVFRYDPNGWQRVWEGKTIALAKAADGPLLGLSSAHSGTTIVADGRSVRLPADVANEVAYSQSIATCADGRIYATIYNGIAAYDAENDWHIESTGAGPVSVVTCDEDGTVWAFGDDGVVVKRPK